MRASIGKRAGAGLALAVALSLATSAEVRSEIIVPLRPDTPTMLPESIPAGVGLPVRIGEDFAQEMQCLAQNIYFEARSESHLGQIAVAKVTLNRVASKRFPDTVCGVVRQGGNKRNRCQFSWYCDGKDDQPNNLSAWHRARNIAYRVVFQRVTDPTRGAMWYHADYVKPRWTRKLRQTGRIGRHVYYRGS